MARIVVFGATGRAGRKLVREAAAAGHEVVAFARDPARVEALPGVRAVRGDVLDPAAVRAALAGADGALVALGGGTTAEPGEVRSRGVACIVAALEEQGGGRVVALGGGGVLDAVPGPGLRNEQPRYPAVFRRVSAEHRAAWEHLRASSLRWTFVCPPDIPDRDATGNYRVLGDRMPPEPKALPNGDLAAFMVEEWARERFVGRRVGICG